MERLELPPYEDVTLPHLKYVMANKKAQIHENDANRYRVPHYEGLTVEDILKFAKDYT